MLVSHQAAQLSIHFFVKENQWCVIFLRVLFKDKLLGEKELKKAQHWVGIKSTTSRVLLHRRVLYCCAKNRCPRSIRHDNEKINGYSRTASTFLNILAALSAC